MLRQHHEAYIGVSAALALVPPTRRKASKTLTQPLFPVRNQKAAESFIWSDRLKWVNRTSRDGSILSPLVYHQPMKNYAQPPSAGEKSKEKAPTQAKP